MSPNKIKNALFFAALIITGVFFLQNTHVVSVKFLFWEVQMSQIIFMPLVGLLGFILGVITVRMFSRV